MAKSNKSKFTRKRPDPYFKQLTRDLMARRGLLTGETGLSQAMETDLVVIVPHKVNLKNTWLYFLLWHNVIEFKSQNDQLSWRKFANAVSRAYRYSAQHNIPLQETLNLIVSSRYPDSLMRFLTKQGCPLVQDEQRKWLWEGKIGPQPIIIIVCAELPLEKEWYDWLAFAPSDGEKWQQFALKMFKEQNAEYIRILEELKPKEIADMKSMYEEFMERGELDPKEFRRIERERTQAAHILVNTIARKKPEQLPELLSDLTLEERMAGLKPEERVAGLKPEERVAGLKPEDVLAGLKPEEREQLRKLLNEQSAQDDK